MINRLLSPATEYVYAALRIVIGVLFAFHGLQKVFGVFTEFQPPVGSQLWIGGVIELVTGLLIALKNIIDNSVRQRQLAKQEHQPTGSKRVRVTG